MSTINSAVDEKNATQIRLVEAAAELFGRHGYAATGVKAILAAANAPYGSLYHWFPGGKQQLGVAALTHRGEQYRAKLESQYPPGADVVAATRTSFVEAANQLEASDYTDACPIATIALEVASSDEPMRTAAAVFESWLAVLEQRFMEAGMTAERAREVAVEVFCLIEGAQLLSRTMRSQLPLHIAGQAAANTVAAELAAQVKQPRKSGRRK